MLRAAESTAAIAGGCAQTSSAVAPERRTRSICGERSVSPAGSVSFVATASGFPENARATSAAPWRPYALSSPSKRDLELLRDQVLRVAERDPAIRGRDPEDVRPLLHVNEPGAAVVGDAHRNPVAARELPGRVDPRAVGDHRQRVRIERAPCVLDRPAR